MNIIRLLITRVDRIGDVVLSTPIPREVKRKYPNSFVAVLVRDYTKDIYQNSPYVDEIIVYNKQPNKPVLPAICLRANKPNRIVFVIFRFDGFVDDKVHVRFLEHNA